MEIITVFLFTLVLICFGISIYTYVCLGKVNYFISELSKMVSRTFREYYKGEDIEPMVINNGIDLVWKGDVEGSFNENNKQGFITVMTNEGNINSPINDVKEADVIAGKISHLVYEYIKDRDEI